MAGKDHVSDSNISTSHADENLLSSAILTLTEKIDKFEELPSKGKGKGKGKRLSDDREHHHGIPAKKPAKDGGKLREPTQKRDLQLFKIQQALVKGIIPIVRLTDLSVIEKKGLDQEGVQQIKQFGLQALSLLTHVNYELNMQRKQLTKPDIGRDYASLCSPHVPFTDWLFGDDLQKQLKDIGDVNKIGAKVQGHREPPRPTQDPAGQQQ